MWTCARQCSPLCKVVPTTSYVGAPVGWALHLQGALLPPSPRPFAQAKPPSLWCLANRAGSLCVDCKMPSLYLHLQHGVLCSLRSVVAAVSPGKWPVVLPPSAQPAASLPSYCQIQIQGNDVECSIALSQVTLRHCSGAKAERVILAFGRPDSRHYNTRYVCATHAA